MAAEHPRAAAEYRLRELETGTTPGSKLRAARALRVSTTAVSYVDRDARQLVEHGHCSTLERVYQQIRGEAAIPAAA
jgi:hypothetical protein